MAVLLKRLMRPEEVTCPAGELVGDANVRCSIEQHTLDGRTETDSITSFCTGDHGLCLTWQAARKVESKGGDLRKILEAERDDNAKKRATKALRDARLRAAQKLMVDPGPDGQAFRKRLGLKVHL